MVKEVMAITIDETDEFGELLGRRKSCWIRRLVQNFRRHPKIVGPITTDEVERELKWCILREQDRAKNRPKYEEDRLQLNLQPNSEGILECRGRIQGLYPTYLPDDSQFTEKFVEQAHQDTLHGGVGLTMAKVRERYWVPRLRRVTRRVIKQCWGCKRFQALAHAQPPPGLLPTSRTEGTTAFETIGVDFTGPIKYRRKGKVESKAYLVLYACSLTQGLFLEILPNLETGEFICSPKRFIARRGRLKKIYSDNGKTFIAAARWLKKAQYDEQPHTILTKHNISWTFNLSRAPWWGGQFEPLVGVVNSAFHKTIGNDVLTWPELCDVVLDVEITVNNRPLCYVEDDIQLPVLTPSSMLFQGPNLLPEQEPHHLQDTDLRKREKYLRRCKEAMWSRWTKEYLRALRERHNMKHPGTKLQLAVGDVVIIKSH